MSDYILHDRRIKMAEELADAVPETTIHLKGIAPNYVPRDYHWVDRKIAGKSFENGSAVTVETFDF